MSPESVRAIVRWLLPVLILALAPQPGGLRAQIERWDGQIIQDVQWIGLETLATDTMEHYLLGPAPADEPRRLHLQELNDRLKRLWQRELIDDIDLEVEPVEGGVRLIVKVVERPILTSVEYVGLKKVNRSDVLDQVDRDRIQVFEGQPIQYGELERLKLAIQGLYKEKGYRFAEVSYSLEDVAAGQVRATFSIDEGDKVKISDIAFDGNTVFSDWRLRRSMKKTKESGLISRFSKKDIYNPANIDEDLDSIRDLYHKAGYKDVLLAKPEIEVVAKHPKAETIADQKRRLAVTIPVEEGERWRFGEVTIDGNEVFSDELLLRQFQHPRGGWLRSKVIDDAVENIDKLYKSIGYIFSRVETELKEKADNVADVVVHVDEQDQYRVGRLEFQGNTKTKDKVLRREMFVQEGTVMNMTAIQNSLLKIRQLNYFKLNEEEPISFDFDSDKKTVDLTVKGDEAERTELQFGGGWSEFDGFFGQFALRTTNFLGRGETLGISVQSGRRTDLFDLQYQIPWFLDRPQSLGARAYKQDYDVRLLANTRAEQQSSGASVTYGRSLGHFQSINLSYIFSDYDYLNTIAEDGNPDTNDDPDGDGFAFRSEVAFKQSSLRPFWIYNTLDSRYEPTRGMSLSGSLEYAGGVLGGDTEFVRPEVDFTWFKPISRQPFKSSFGFHAEVGLIKPFNGTELYSLQRYYLGGERSVRGFRTRTITAREIGDEDGNGVSREILYDTNGFPLGGEKELSLSVEYHLMLGGPFRVVFFADAGGVFTSAGIKTALKDKDGNFLRDENNSLITGETRDQFDLSALRRTAGVELRIQVPLFPAPLRFIYSTNLDPLKDDRFQSFDFSLSTSF